MTLLCSRTATLVPGARLTVLVTFLEPILMSPNLRNCGGVLGVLAPIPICVIDVLMAGLSRVFR